MKGIPRAATAATAMAARLPRLNMQLVASRRATGTAAFFGFELFFAVAVQLAAENVEGRVAELKDRSWNDGAMTQESLAAVHHLVFPNGTSPFNTSMEDGRYTLSHRYVAGKTPGEPEATLKLSIGEDGNITTLITGHAAAIATVESLEEPVRTLLTWERFPITLFIPIPGGRPNAVTFQPALTDFTGAFKYSFDEAEFTASKHRCG